VNTLKAAIYARVSTFDEDSENRFGELPAIRGRQAGSARAREAPWLSMGPFVRLAT
jgi:hypothetical protein